MCLILFLYDIHKDYRLILGANRDEFYERPTAPLGFWDDHPNIPANIPANILAGRDRKGGGTWMGVSRKGRFAALTNYRDPASLRSDAPSRGEIVSGFLLSPLSPEAYLADLHTAGKAYNGFNLIAGDHKELYYYSNREGEIRRLEPGLYGLSNRFLDTPWPKVQKGKAGLSELLPKTHIDPEDIFRLLKDCSVPPDALLPDTGMGLEWERILSPVFIRSPSYGTRSSSVLLMDYGGWISFYERTFIGRSGKETEEDRHFTIHSPMPIP